jgi:hypothetical protein
VEAGAAAAAAGFGAGAGAGNMDRAGEITVSKPIRTAAAITGRRLELRRNMGAANIGVLGGCRGGGNGRGGAQHVAEEGGTLRIEEEGIGGKTRHEILPWERPSAGCRREAVRIG